MKFWLTIVWIAFSASCAPIPDSLDSAMNQQDSSLSNIRPHALASQSTSNTNNTSSSTEPSSSSIQVVAQIAEIPTFEDPAIIPQQIPNQYKRDIRVGLSFDKYQIQLQCIEYCHIDLDSDNIGRSPNAVSIKFDSDKLLLYAGTNIYQSLRKKILIRSFNANQAISFNGNSYRGALEIEAVNNKLRVINVLSVEDYLKGVVPHEIGKLDESMYSALQVQAIAARTYAYKHFGSRASLGFDVYADVRDQVYEGKNGETSLINQAIDDTKGVVIQWQGKLIESYYHSTSAGHTESLETWKKPPQPYLKAVSDLDSNGQPWCHLSSFSQWKFHYTWDELTKIILRYASTANPDKSFAFNQVIQLEQKGKLPGGRTAELVVQTDKGSFSVWGDKTRWLLRNPQNPSKILPSAWFTIQQNQQGVTIVGKGSGHGIGMSQMGVRARSKAGQNARQILTHYYQGVQLVQW